LKIRVIFERLTKKHGEALLKSSAIPADHKILTYINKQAAYKKRRHERVTANKHYGGDDMDDIEDNDGERASDSDSDSDDEKRKTNTSHNKKRKRSDNNDMVINNEIVMDEREGQVDLLDASALGKVSIKRKRTKNDSDDSDDDSLIEFTSDGKLKINDDDDSDNDNKFNDKLDDFDDSDSDFDGIDSKEMKAKMKKRQSALEAVKRKKHKVELEGATSYKGKKAGGDVKKKGTKIEPYSYIRLDPKLLNKRRKHEAARQFKGIGKSRVRQMERGRQAKGGRSKANKRRR